MSPPERHYLSGFGNQMQSEAVAGALPVGRNSPQQVAHGLYAELLSGSAFTAPRHDNRRSWLYRRQPSALSGRSEPLAHATLKTGAKDGVTAPPDPMRWHPIAIPEAPLDFVDGLHTVVVNGDADAQTGVAAHLALMNRSMQRRAFVNADGEMLIVPQQGRLTITTELGVLDVAPGQIALLPRGMVFKVGVDGPSRAYVCENYGAAFRMPELGPIGSNGLANARDFQAPVAAFEDGDGDYEIVRKFGGRLWRGVQRQSPFNVVAWHGNLVPLRYDTAHFMTIGSISFDHPDPSIFTVLTSPSDTPGWANCDFVIFPPRWMVAEDTFRPPWYHRNVMAEFMGLVHGQYDAKPEGFKPGGMSLHNTMVPHGPDAEAFNKATNAALAPHKLEDTLAFMFESRWRFHPTEFALRGGALDPGYADFWAGLADHFKTS
ncbi:MAG: homogentisate 1,2-dioxygenase [Rubrivivax sp.]|nr:homogentisate 1,2-dioxygenase [Rubrivivax sp.]